MRHLPACPPSPAGRPLLTLLTVLAFLPLLAVGPARAAPVEDLDTAVAPGSDLTYARLGQAVFRGVARDEAGGGWAITADKVLRQPATRERVTLPAGAKVGSVESFRVRGGGRVFLVTVWTVAAQIEYPGDRATVLAVFPDGQGEPTDVASVQTDVFCSVQTKELFDLGPDQGFAIYNRHSNSNQSYMDSGLFHIVDGRLRRIASVFTLDVRMDCGSTFFEVLRFGVSPRPGSDRPDVTATVALSPRADCPGGKTSVRPRTFRETYRFDPAHKGYLPLGKGFAALDAWNEKNL